MNINTTQFHLPRIFTMRILSSLLLQLCLAVNVVSAAPPNFVIFVADDMAWDDCGAYGNDAIRTPSIDRLAAEGMRFDRAFLTCSSCSPSRCSMLTGRYPHATDAGELHLPLPAEQVLFSTPLRKAGYYTAAVGKWHLGPKVESQFDLVKTGGGPGGEQDWVGVLKNRPAEKPFFLWLAATDPHRGYSKGAVDPPHLAAKVIVPPIFPDTPEVRDDLALYYDEIARFDEYVGKVRVELERQQVLDNTLLLVISDNGRPFPRCKTTVYDDGVRTPFVVRFPPLVKAGSISNSLVSTVDIAPTLLELAGQESLESFQGESFASVLKDPLEKTRDFVYAEHNWHDYRAFERGVRSERFCYVSNRLTGQPCTPPADAVNSPTYREMQRLYEAGTLSGPQSLVFQSPRPDEEFYDADADPHCLVNLAADPEFQKEIEKHRDALRNWQQKTEDVFPGIEKLTPDGFDRVTGDRLPGVAAPHPSLRKK